MSTMVQVGEYDAASGRSGPAYAAQIVEDADAPTPPARGMSIWTFPVTDVDEIERRARRHGTKIVAGPVRYSSPSLGQHRAMTLRAPNGFLVEVFAPAESAQR